MAVNIECRGADGDEMTAAENPQRHLSSDGFREYLSSGAPSVVKIEGSPAVYLVIDPAPRKVALRTPLESHAVPDLSAYRHISAATIHWNDTPWCELRIEGDIIVEAYPILCAIADRIQLRSLDFRAAVIEALGSLRELLAGRGRLAEEQEIGLFGELLLLRHLLGKLPASRAIACWRGPEREEHDFVLPDVDVEVKSTTSDVRCHWINDIRQLEPTLGRRLQLLSIQLTGAGAGGSSLPELIDQVRELVPDGAPSEELSRKLASLNWHSKAAALYTSRFRLRTPPAIFDVDAAFPALTPPRLAAAHLDQSRFKQIRYLIELAGLPASHDQSGLVSNIRLEP